ncbi:Uncharacterised protein [Mycobacteroides abscessus]|nr:Uncharacterised protein [Mycobacteroides abscessus]
MSAAAPAPTTAPASSESPKTPHESAPSERATNQPPNAPSVRNEPCAKLRTPMSP